MDKMWWDKTTFARMEKNERPKRSRSEQLDKWSRSIIALVIGVIAGALVMSVGLPTLGANLPKILIAFLALVIATGLLVFWVVARKERVLKRVFGVNDTDLSEFNRTARALLDSAMARDVEESKKYLEILVRRGTAWYAWVSFRRWSVVVFQSLFVALGGLLGTILLYNQNKLLTQQNELMRQQSKRLDQQTYLQEAERRSSLNFLMGNMLDALDEELRSDVGQPGVRDISPQLIGRIISLSNSLRPYRYLDGDSLVARELSPERGQLLLSIIHSEIDRGSLRRVYRSADFSFADLRDAVLSGEYLAGINLSSANLNGATLDEINLSNANLSNAEMNGVIMPRAALRGSRFRQTLMHDANLSFADLSGANFSGADLTRSKLNGANLSGAHFSKTLLQKSDWTGATLARAMLSSALLDSVTVGEANWLTLLDGLRQDSVRGTYVLKSLFRVDSVDTPLGVQYRLVRR